MPLPKLLSSLLAYRACVWVLRVGAEMCMWVSMCVPRRQVTKKPESFKDCIVWARLKFEELFTNNIKQVNQPSPPHLPPSLHQYHSF